MPIYEFFCSDCDRVFNFYSPTVNTTKIPLCPKCKRRELKRMMSPFAIVSGKQEESGSQDFSFDEAKMEKALHVLEKDMATVNEDDPRQAAALLRKMTEAVGGNLDGGMEEALRRMEAGEDPEAIEAEIEDQLNPEAIFSEKKNGGSKPRKITYDETLYEL
ncbi:MAG: zinc ribbon domain-containing protein [Pseudomonadota bacterium]